MHMSIHAPSPLAREATTVRLRRRMSADFDPDSFAAWSEPSIRKTQSKKPSLSTYIGVQALYTYTAYFSRCAEDTFRGAFY